MSIQAFVANKYDIEYTDMRLAGAAVVKCIEEMYEYNEDVIVHSNAWDFDMYVLDGTEFDLSRDLIEQFILQSNSDYVNIARELLTKADPEGNTIHVMIN